MSETSDQQRKDFAAELSDLCDRLTEAGLPWFVDVDLGSIGGTPAHARGHACQGEGGRRMHLLSLIGALDTESLERLVQILHPGNAAQRKPETCH